MAPSEMMAWTEDADQLPSVPGAYALLVVTQSSIPHPSRRMGNAPPLPAGVYIYLGSARGPGGIRARCARHLRVTKSRHWHVDHLAAAARPGSVRAAPFANDTECGLGARLTARPDLAVPVPGFGNSDCRTCASHLFRIDSAIPETRLLGLLSGV